MVLVIKCGNLCQQKLIIIYQWSEGWHNLTDPWSVCPVRLHRPVIISWLVCSWWNPEVFSDPQCLLIFLGRCPQFTLSITIICPYKSPPPQAEQVDSVGEWNNLNEIYLTCIKHRSQAYNYLQTKIRLRILSQGCKYNRWQMLCFFSGRHYDSSLTECSSSWHLH